MSYFVRILAHCVLAGFICTAMAYSRTSFAQPSVVSVNVPANGAYGPNQNLDFVVNFDAAVNVDTSGGTPDIDITMNVGGTVPASYISGSGTSALTFRNIVTAGESDPDGITVGALKLNGGTIQDAVNNNAILTLNSVASTAAVLVDTTPPSAVSMTVPVDGTYSAGQNLDFTVTFSEPVTVTGTPQIAITLDVGGTVHANFLFGSGTSALTFRFTVQPGEQDSTGIVTGSSIGTNGGTIQDAASNNADLSIVAVEPSTAGIDINSLTPVRLQSFIVE